MKKHIFDFLHLWPVNIVIPIVLLLILFPGIANAKVKANDINFPAGLYTDEIKSCKAIGYATLDQQFTVNGPNKTHWMRNFPGFDWPAYHIKYGNSRDVPHEVITKPASIFAAVAHKAIANGDEDKINKAKQYLIKIAESKTLLNTITLNQLKNKPKCWKNGDPNSPCWSHQYSMARQAWTIVMVGATQLKPYMTKKEFKVVDKWAKKFWKKYYKASLKKKGTHGFYGQANGGLGILVYAHWSDNNKLAADEINFRFKSIDHFFMDDGYIKGSSFRGNRSQFYHTYGVNSVLGYIWIAKQFGAAIPEKIENKVINSIHVSNLAIEDREKFLSREWKRIRVVNTTKGGNDWNTHPEAFGIDTLMLEMYGIELAHDRIYLERRKKSGIDNNIGFNPNCINDLKSQQIDTSGWMNFETNEDQGKRDRIIKTLITKITKRISKDTSANTNDIKNWVTLQIEPLDWDKDLDRAVDRKNLRNKLIEQGIKKFK